MKAGSAISRWKLNEKWIPAFVFLAGAVLLLTGIAKAFTVSTNIRLLQTQDPVFGLSFRLLLLSVGVVEIAIGLVCLLLPRCHHTCSLIAWISLTIFSYRVALWAMAWKGPCGCLGSLADALPLSPTAVDWLMKTTLAFLLAGSFAALLVPRKANASPINCND